MIRVRARVIGLGLGLGIETGDSQQSRSLNDFARLAASESSRHRTSKQYCQRWAQGDSQQSRSLNDFARLAGS
jgi:hypothetical protein